MQRRSPPFNALYAFVVTAKHLNLTHAAKELFVTQGAVSRKISTLESYLGFKVFHRHARGLTLTQEGAELLPELESAFSHLLQTTEKAIESKTELRLKAPTCSMRWLVPKLMALQKSQPQLHVSLNTTTEHDINFNTENYDLAIVYSTKPIHKPNAYKLFDETVCPVVASHLYEENQPFDLNQFTFLHPSSEQFDWIAWLTQNHHPVRMEKNQYFDTMDLAISAAIQGFGVAMADENLVQEDLRMKRLIKPYEGTVRTGASYYLMYRRNSSRSGLITTFLDAFIPTDEPTNETIDKKDQTLS